VFRGEAYADVPHFAGKHTVERMIDALDLPATVLRLSTVNAYEQYLYPGWMRDRGRTWLKHAWCQDWSHPPWSPSPSQQRGAADFAD
jgi:hypothetical protein